MKFINRFFGICIMLMASQVNATTIFAPTDGTVNFLFGDLLGGTLAMFDDNDLNYTGAFLNIDVPSVVSIDADGFGGNYIATDSNGTLNLSDSDQFILGLNVGGAWLTDSGVVSLGANAYTVSFNNGGSVVEVDVQVVPVPAAVWLMGSGLLGLLGLSRKNKVKITV